MSILHGSWVIKSNQRFLFIWGETWRNLGKEKFDLEAEEPLEYPFYIDQATQLDSFCQDCDLNLASFLGTNLDLMERWQKEYILLPSQKKAKSKTVVPIISQEFLSQTFSKAFLILFPWYVQGFYLNAKEAIKFFQEIPLGETTYLGDDLKFWSHIYRWVLDLICRQKFLPVIDEDNSTYWRPLLDSNIDRIRLTYFVQLMPSVCRGYQEDEEESPIDHQELILDFLATILDSQIRSLLELNPPANASSSLQKWLNSLGKNDVSADLDLTEISRLKNALNTWIFPLQDNLVTSHSQLAETKYRACFKLEPPANIYDDSEDNNWQILYCLQALDNPDFIVNTSQIWQNLEEDLIIDSRTIENPQETLLKGLGLAARIYSPIAESLQEAIPSFCVLNPIQVYEFIRGIAWQLQDNGLGVILPQGLAPGSNEKRLGVKIEAKVTPKKGERLSLNTLLNYDLKVAVGNQTLSKKEFENLLAQRSPIVEINGEWLALQPTDVKAAQEIFAQANSQINLTVEDALRLSTQTGETIAKLPVVSFEASGILENLINNLSKNKTIEVLPTPSEFKGTLRPYQERGFSWLSFLEQWNFGACLADDMGLGKTIQLIAFLVYLKQEDLLTNPILIVCPTSVLNNWQKEVRKFAPSLKTMIHHGEQRSKEKNFVKQVEKLDLVITSYSLVYRDLDTLKTVEWQGIVLDEAQNIKNSQAKQSQAVRELNTEFRIALTGTPVENRLAELWSILDFLNPNYLGNRQFFQRRFAIPIEKYGDKQSLQTLRSLVQPFILRRLKTDKDIIQDLPEKQEMNVFCGLSSEQAQLYQQLVDKSLEKINDSYGIKRHGLILTLLMQLKQICNHPAHFLKEDNLNNAARSGKLLRLEEMLEELISEGDRALIFTQFAEWGKLLQPYLERKLGVKTLFLYGATKTEQREAMIDSFQNDPDGPPLFLLSLKAGGTGLNLTRANHVFHVDRWWNPAVENQATDRAFRIGQKRNVQVHKFVCTGTLEEKINDIIESKKQLAEQTIDAGENWLTDLDTDQLRNLLLLERDTIID
jgi:SNF2 family DNA or RNA helicase